MIKHERGAPEAKRAAILDAAQKLFSRYGYRRTSIDDIAREAEIAKGTVYLSFKSKEEIFRALCESMCVRVQAEAARASAMEAPIERRLAAILEAKYGFYFDLVQRSPHAAELMDSKNRLSEDIFTPADRKYAKTLRDTIETAARRGEIDPARAGLDAAGVAELLSASATGIEKTANAPATFHRRLRDLARMTTAALTSRAAEASPK
ncbi:MAG TPA: TetR/AcrR family transcriptional regulator [Candidatus Binataceae bacterium]|nr:TetR/AcrR family transcriptional regulator [Candidatus Binataceae bacterium]